LLSKQSLILETLLGSNYHFVSPNFIFAEIFKYKEKIVKHSKLTEEELLDLLASLLSRIHFISPELISAENFSRALSLCKDVDEKDTVFVALAMEIGAMLWTGDKKLRTALTSKGFTNFFSINTE
jgi:predicted nucleic acid-binding protein